jgi:hypothetical protein
MHPQLVGTQPRGVRWGVWPLTFEEYVSDLEPDLGLSRATGNPRNRLVQWHRLTRNEVPPGWHAFSTRPSKLEGFAELTDLNYTRLWNKTARYDQRAWHERFAQKKYTITTAEYTEFAAAYAQSLVAKKAGFESLDSVARRLGPPMHLWVARLTADGSIAAGMAVLDSPGVRSSYYTCGFVLPCIGNDPVMTGLIDHWFTASLKKDMRYLHTGAFWMPGEPKSWQGFSRFKAKFGMHYIYYQPLLVRFVRGTLF